jgi:hypothetical protein
MTIPFRDAREEDVWGLAGFLRFVTEPGEHGMRAALFLINSRGEPTDFSFSRIDLPAPFLWREGEARRAASASLVAALFQACPSAPALILALADEAHPKLFEDDILADAPVCRVVAGTDSEPGQGETPETLPDAIQLFWIGPAPEQDSPARHLLDALIARQLITEPFERAEVGLTEAFRET